MLSNKVEISGELSEEEENIVDDILKKNKNQYIGTLLLFKDITQHKLDIKENCGNDE